MATNKEKIKKIYKLNDELQLLIESESDAYKKARLNDKEVIIIKRNGKDAEVSQSELWEEIRITGNLKGDAAKVLRKLYPNVFKLALKRESKNKEITEYIAEQFGFDWHQMTIANYLKLTEAVIEWKLSEK